MIYEWIDAQGSTDAGVSGGSKKAEQTKNE